MRLFMIIDLYVGYKEACCYGVEKVENSTIIVMESEVWYFISCLLYTSDAADE